MTDSRETPFPAAPFVATTDQRGGVGGQIAEPHLAEGIALTGNQVAGAAFKQDKLSVGRDLPRNRIGVAPPVPARFTLTSVVVPLARSRKYTLSAGGDATGMDCRCYWSPDCWRCWRIARSAIGAEDRVERITAPPAAVSEGSAVDTSCSGCATAAKASDKNNAAVPVQLRGSHFMITERLCVESTAERKEKPATGKNRDRKKPATGKNSRRTKQN